MVSDPQHKGENGGEEKEIDDAVVAGDRKKSRIYGRL